MTADPFLVPVTKLRRHPGARQAEQRRGALDELAVAGTHVAAGTPVDVDVTLEVAVGGIAVSGTVATAWRGECRRCACLVEGEVTAEVRELYRPAGDAEDEEETYLLGPDYLDLRPLARDAVLLELPIAPLCRADCAGLCPTCGADRNDGPCGCAAPRGDPRWAALDTLRGDAG